MTVGRLYDDKGERETVWDVEAEEARAASWWDGEPDPTSAGRARGDLLTEWDTLTLPGLDLGADALDLGGT